MARMSIDDMFLRDTRVLRLARAAGWSKYEARGRLLEIFALVYDRVDAGTEGDLQPADIDLAAEHDGLSALMIEHGLAEQTRRGVRVKGARERTNYLATRHESGRLGGLKSAEVRREKSKQRAKVTFAESEGRANPSADPSASASADPSVDPQKKEIAAHAPPTIDEFKAKADRLAPAHNARAAHPRKPKPSDPTDIERGIALRILGRLSTRNGVSYSGAKDHVRLIVARLRDGVSEADMRKVIGYCAVELEWAEKPNMQTYLRPETLFGPQTIARYLDPARTWFDKQGLRLDDEPTEVAS